MIVEGSSPLTRGKRYLGDRGEILGGLIPAHAGKTQLTSLLGWTGRGSSPLTRGKLPLTPNRAFARRLIPAHAGKTGRCGR